MRHSDAWITEDTHVGDEILAGLTRPGQKELPSRYFYDDLGSALFEAITLLPEYGLTRADLRILTTHADEIRRFGRPSLVIELGSGGGGKARPVLEALAQEQSILYCPIDVSASALEQCRLGLAERPEINVHPIEANFLGGLQAALRFRDGNGPALILFLGSSIGNQTPEETAEFLAGIHRLLKTGDLFLISADLEKDDARMLNAYDDGLGVTAAFNLNILRRVNREIGADFDVSRFQHVARYDRAQRRIEMHLMSRDEQVVRLGGGRVLRLRQGETIRTEYSYKYRLEDIRAAGRVAGFQVEAQWVDHEWPFSQTLLKRM
ncbi:MAG TPA: L-histidine N(alpha)-methyltransferase [Terriglobia bacterium]|nr:L-histidine N(alpha)-methyltransferase [Terriglobia bacterium]